METVLPAPVADEADAPPKPKIDLADALTVIPRLLAGFFLGGLSVMYVVAGNWGMVAFLGFSSAMMLYWGFRLVKKMRGENVDYIAYRAEVEAAERAEKQARKGTR